MPPLYIVEQGAKLTVNGRRLVVEKDDEKLLQVPFAHTSSVILFGNIAITTPAMKRLMDASIDVIFLSQGGDYQGRLVGPLSKFGQLRQDQYELLRDGAFRLSAAQRIVAGKCQNMRTLLQRYNGDLQLAALTEVIASLKRFIERTGRTTQLSALLGVEGAASSAYFRGFRLLLKHGWRFEERNRRPPKDPVNVLLSFGYTLLTRDLEGMIGLVGLDPYLGVLHTTEYGRPSLALDLVEEFRAIIVDLVVLWCLNSQQITSDEFRVGAAGERPILMSDSAKRKFIAAYEQRLALTITHPVTGEKMIYRRAFEIQTRFMARCFREKNPGYTPFVVRP